jgi:hypothetical protein
MLTTEELARAEQRLRNPAPEAALKRRKNTALI